MWGRKKNKYKHKHKYKYKFDRMSLVVSPSSIGVGYEVYIVNKEGVILYHHWVLQNDWDAIINGGVTGSGFDPIRLLMEYVEERRREELG